MVNKGSIVKMNKDKLKIGEVKFYQALHKTANELSCMYELPVNYVRELKKQKMHSGVSLSVPDRLVVDIVSQTKLEILLKAIENVYDLNITVVQSKVQSN